MQATVRNSLADRYLIGISSGALVGAVAVLSLVRLLLPESTRSHEPDEARVYLELFWDEVLVNFKRVGEETKQVGSGATLTPKMVSPNLSL